MTFDFESGHINFIILVSASIADNYERNEEEKGSEWSTREQKSVGYQEFENPVHHYNPGQTNERQEVIGIYASGEISLMG